jgi:hypothetical protein
MKQLFTDLVRDIKSAEVVEKHRIFAEEIADSQTCADYAKANPAEVTQIIEDALCEFMVPGNAAATSQDMWKALMVFVQSKTAHALAKDICSDKNVARMLSRMQSLLVDNDKTDFGMFLPMTKFYGILKENPRATVELMTRTGDPQADLMQLLMAFKR